MKNNFGIGKNAFRKLRHHFLGQFLEYRRLGVVVDSLFEALQPLFDALHFSVDATGQVALDFLAFCIALFDKDCGTMVYVDVWG